MKAAPLPHDEAERLAALHRYLILDAAAEAEFDDFTNWRRISAGFRSH